ATHAVAALGWRGLDLLGRGEQPMGGNPRVVDAAWCCHGNNPDALLPIASPQQHRAKPAERIRRAVFAVPRLLLADLPAGRRAGSSDRLGSSRCSTGDCGIGWNRAGVPFVAL